MIKSYSIPEDVANKITERAKEMYTDSSKLVTLALVKFLKEISND